MPDNGKGFHWQKFNPKPLARRLFNALTCLLALLGSLYLLAGLTGSPVVPPFYKLTRLRPDLLPLRNQVLTADIDVSASAEAHWQALRPARELLGAIQPEIAQWLETLNRESRIIWRPMPTLFNWPVLASYGWQANVFYFGPDFWQLNEGDKASIIAHEYFHHRQNKFWMLADTAVEALTGQLSTYGSRVEDEAHLYQMAAYCAMDMPPSGIILGYYSQRNLYRFATSFSADCH